MTKDEYDALPLPEAKVMFHRNPATGVVYVTVGWDEFGDFDERRRGVRFPVSEDMLLDRVMRDNVGRNPAPPVAAAEASEEALTGTIDDWLLVVNEARDDLDAGNLGTGPVADPVLTFEEFVIVLRRQLGALSW